MILVWTIAGIVAGAWLLVALLQLGDVATAFLDSRTARDRDIPGRIARERTNELFWVIPLGALVALGIGLAIDQVGRALFDTGTGIRQVTLETGTLFLLGVAVLVVGIAFLALAAVAATDPISYSALRREMREYEGERITPKQLIDYRRRLARIDARTRSRMRPSRSVWTTPNVLRLASIIVGLLVIVATGIAESEHPTAQGASLVAVSIVAPLVSGLFAALGIRFAISADAAWRRVYARQRVDILKLLDGFEKSTRKRVAGLGDRVARALKILGEQQP